MDQLRQVFVGPDGKIFDTRKEAQDYLRRPKVTAALNAFTKSNKELVGWLVENQEAVEAAFETGTICRVTKSERNKLAKALEAVKESGNPKANFVVENAVAILDSFRWPSVQRMTDEEKLAAAKASLVAASNNQELADYILANKDAILEAYQSGVEKRQINPKAQEALAAYRAKKAAEKNGATAKK